MSFCFQCGTAVVAGDRFCGNCGAVLQQPGAAPTPARGESAAVAAAAPAGTTAPAPPGASEPLKQSPPPAETGALDEAQASTPVSVSSRATGDIGAGASADADMEQTLVGEPGADSPSGQPPQQDAAEPSPESVPADAPAAVQGQDPPSSAPTGEVSEPRAPEEPSRHTSQPEAAAPRRHTDEAARPGGTAPRTGFSGNRSVTKQLDAGTLLNSRYEIVRKIGGGGMGAVYYAKDKNLGDQPRAVKEMMQANIDEAQQEKAVADFRRESMLLASLEHRSIPTIYDYFYDDRAARFYLVMKYISGGDFLMRLRNSPTGRIDEQTVADWGMQVADVLHYLHNQRPPIIYRDLKPANLMIDGNSGRVMLIDFGIARWVQKEEKGVTAVGTMGYAPPELFSGKVEPRSDIYSLGATMFHLMTGSDPQDNPLLIFDFAKNPRPRQINASISNEMERILMRAVEYNPEGRFRSAAELRDALAQHLERLRAGAVTYGAAVMPGGVHESAQTVAQEMVFCGFCGGRIAGDDVFCAHCGARQPIASAQAAARQARATAQLVVMGTTELDVTFSIQKESVLVGRTDPQSNVFPDVDLSRFDPETKISRRHARIWRQGDTYLVEDLGSVNGTVVNETVRLGPRQPRTLEHGDKLRLGETTLHFLVG
jgi:serine/threonine-protein kinase